MKIALLSNVNMNSAIRLLKRDLDVYEVEGYGNELGTLLNPSASIYSYKPDIIFMVEDLMEIINHDLDILSAANYIDKWFEEFFASVKKDYVYYVSDAFLYGPELNVLVDKGAKNRIEQLWQGKLEKLVEDNSNIRIFPYRHLVELEGEKNSFSTKMWYMGKILHTNSFLQVISANILDIANKETRAPKKVLLLDLDNTLWGGLAGENDITPIVLSEDHTGLAYKNLQRVILAMKKQGVLLGIVSKNNYDDAVGIINDHPHMVLKLDDFAIKKINWENKAENIKEIAKELNLGLDSFVFFDDSDTERQIVKDMLPEVSVPDFPASEENLSEAMVNIWHAYFEKATLTEEDKKKTTQYAENAKREEFKATVKSFDEYLKGLDIKLIRRNEKDHVERITQLINKTNQFNLTTRRHTLSEIEDYVDSTVKKVFAYQASDCFGDYGLIAVAIVALDKDKPSIEEFVMSCRVMGKNIENAILDDIEIFLQSKGYDKVEARYSESAKNKPVKELYPSLGYKTISNSDLEVCYELILEEKPARKFALTRLHEGES